MHGVRGPLVEDSLACCVRCAPVAKRAAAEQAQGGAGGAIGVGHCTRARGTRMAARDDSAYCLWCVPAVNRSRAPAKAVGAMPPTTDYKAGRETHVEVWGATCRGGGGAHVRMHRVPELPLPGAEGHRKSLAQTQTFWSLHESSGHGAGCGGGMAARDQCNRCYAMRAVDVPALLDRDLTSWGKPHLQSEWEGTPERGGKAHSRRWEPGASFYGLCCPWDGAARTGNNGVSINPEAGKGPWWWLRRNALHGPSAAASASAWAANVRRHRVGGSCFNNFEPHTSSPATLTAISTFFLPNDTRASLVHLHLSNPSLTPCKKASASPEPLPLTLHPAYLPPHPKHVTLAETCRLVQSRSPLPSPRSTPFHNDTFFRRRHRDLPAPIPNVIMHCILGFLAYPGDPPPITSTSLTSHPHSHSSWGAVQRMRSSTTGVAGAEEAYKSHSPQGVPARVRACACVHPGRMGSGAGGGHGRENPLRHVERVARDARSTRYGSATSAIARSITPNEGTRYLRHGFIPARPSFECLPGCLHPTSRPVSDPHRLCPCLHCVSGLALPTFLPLSFVSHAAPAVFRIRVLVLGLAAPPSGDLTLKSHSALCISTCLDRTPFFSAPPVSSQSHAGETIRARCDSPGTKRGRARMVAPMWYDEQDMDARWSSTHVRHFVTLLRNEKVLAMHTGCKPAGGNASKVAGAEEETDMNGEIQGNLSVSETLRRRARIVCDTNSKVVTPVMRVLGTQPTRGLCAVRRS
ncbi:hypothetical protein B0H14DRAFT_3164151 [Mycena olivaceomarginata]|nr:hypothetical protein B0H14DRAFT_3164151 [Mycena olivaceomarginata]